MVATSAVKQDNVKNRNRIVAFQERLDALEVEARSRLLRALGAADEALHGLDDALARVASEDWTVDGMRRRIDGLRVRAGSLGATAMKRVAEMPGTAMTRLASGSRVPVQNLSRELDRLAKRLEPSGDGKAERAAEVTTAEPRPAKRPTATATS